MKSLAPVTGLRQLLNDDGLYKPPRIKLYHQSLSIRQSTDPHFHGHGGQNFVITKIASLIQGWVLLKQTCVFSKIEFTRHFIEFLFVETKQIVSSNSNLVSTRQTCGQRSGMAAGNKRRALAFYFSCEFGMCS